MPKAIYLKNKKEIDFYQNFLAKVQHWVNDVAAIVSQAEILAEKYGLSSLDALQMASAVLAEAEEVVTSEKSTKPMFRVTTLKVVSIISL